VVVVLLFVGLLMCQPCWGQKSEYDSYPEFRNVIGPKFREAHPTSSLKDVVSAYAADLNAHGIDEREIERRTELILLRRCDLKI
jgi:hypothetical protein